MRWTAGGKILVALCVTLACPKPPPAVETRALREGGSGVPAPVDTNAPAKEAGLDAREPDASPDAARDAPPAGEELHLSTKEALRSLAALAMELDAGSAPLLWSIATEPGRFNQGNPELARHAIDRARCEEGLRGVTLQTEAQRTTCHGKRNMVPIYRGADAGAAQACIDVFEFPDEACELPFVWGTPSAAERLCKAEGKRLCTQPEWTLACAGDPAGGPDRAYAYGDTLDLTVCNTNKPHPFGPDGETWLCSARTAETAWATCATETEPAGAFPGCRSRFGVYDLHGNVAEMMTRLGADKQVLTQLKGSAFFYVDVARQPSERQKPGTRETYPDHCGYDPRWHVEELKDAGHSNYHLGFRCCLGL